MTDQLFAAFKGILGLQEQDRLYLLLAAYLHDIGSFVNNRSHHKHSEYIISSLNLFRLTEHEINIIACIARYHRRSVPLKSHLLYNSLASAEQILVQKLSALLRIANSLDRSHKQKVKKLEVKIKQNQDAVLNVSVAGNFILEQQDFLVKKTFFEEITGNKISLNLK